MGNTKYERRLGVGHRSGKNPPSEMPQKETPEAEEVVILFSDPQYGNDARYLRGRIVKEEKEFITLVDQHKNEFTIARKLILKLRKRSGGEHG